MVLKGRLLLLWSIQFLVVLSLLQGCGDSSTPVGGTTVGPGTTDGSVAPSTHVSFSDGASVNLVPVSATSYIIQAYGFQDIQGIQLKATYDHSQVGNPVVAVGDMLAGSMFVTNTNVPGVVSLVGLLPSGVMPASGSIATITFPQQADAMLRLTFIKIVNPQAVSPSVTQAN